MAQAYSAGLTVTESIVLRKDRILPLKGKVLVKKGQKVKADDVVAETLLPGKVIPLKLAHKLGVPPNMIDNYIKVKAGDFIKKGQVIGETKGIFGFFKTVVKSPTDGEFESISHHTGQALLREPRIPVRVKAFMDGIVVDVVPEEGVVIENKSAYIQGIFGIGGETNGEIKLVVDSPEVVADASKIDESCKDKLVVVGAMANLDLIRKAQQVGVRGIITGGVNDQHLKELLGYDIGVAITGHENIGLTVVCTEGFGEIKMAEKTFDLLKEFNGKIASIHGKTQIRAGVMRPEIIIPIPFDEKDLVSLEVKPPILEVGENIRVIRQPHFGEIGKITGLPEELHKVESETLVRILEADLGNGEKITIPRANVELIES